MMVHVTAELGREWNPVSPTAGNLHERWENSAPQRVLVVDDEPLLRWSVGETLREAAFDVIDVADAASALTAAQHRSGIRAVLLDLVLPDSDDLRLLSRLRGLLPDVPLLLMTAHGSEQLSRLALSLGASAVLAKPFGMEDLPQVLSWAIDKKPPM